MREAVSKDQIEKLAQGMAAGMSKREAATAAGFAPESKSFYGVAKREDFKDRVAELKLRWGETAELGSVIDQLMEGAAMAIRAGNPSAAKLNAASRLLAEAARLKGRLPGAVSHGRLTNTDDDEMSADEWAAKYGPAS